MKTSLRVSLLCLTGLLGLLLVGGLLKTVSTPTASAAEIPGEIMIPTPLPDQPAVIASPDISAIDSPTPSCILPTPGTGACYITWTYLYASSDPNYMITMTVNIDDRSRARFQGFFQKEMYIPSEMLLFQVSCGSPGSGGDPDWGLNHNYVIRGRDSAGLKAANSGQILCPSDVIHVYLPLLRK